MIEDVGDVLIVGAGPVGLLTALGLAQAGRSVTVIEAEADLSDAPRAAVYMPSTIAALEEYGLLNAIKAVAFEGHSFACHVPEFGFKATMQCDVVDDVTYGYSLHCGQDVVGRIAMRHAEQLGTQVRFETVLVGLDQDAQGVVATVTTPQGERRLRAKFVIGTDGARSTVRKLMDIAFEGHTWDERFVATNVYFPFERYGYEPSNFVLDPHHGRVVAVIGTDGLWRVTYSEKRALPEETFMDRLKDRYPHFLPDGASYEIIAARPYNIHQRAAATLRTGRVLLAGDAAHATNPTGGMGLTTAIWDSCILSDVLSAVLVGDEPETILDRYSDERRRVFWDISSPNASMNKRMMEEADPEQRRQDMAMVAQGAEDPVSQRLMMLFPFRVIGDTLRSGSRWNGIDPAAAAGLNLETRAGQLG